MENVVVAMEVVRIAINVADVKAKQKSKRNN